MYIPTIAKSETSFINFLLICLVKEKRTYITIK